MVRRPARATTMRFALGAKWGSHAEQESRGGELGAAGGVERKSLLLQHGRQRRDTDSACGAAEELAAGDMESLFESGVIAGLLLFT